MIRARRVSFHLGWGLAIGLLPLLALAAPPPEPARTGKIDPELADQIAVAGRANFWIRMAEQADLRAAYGMDWHARGWYVYETLAETAQKTQAGAIAYLEAQGLSYESFWIDNSIYVRDGDLSAVQDLAARREVVRVEAEEIVYLPELPEPPAGQEAAVQGLEDWGLAWVHAPEVWALGYDGTGIVVATIDTGVQYDHPQLDETYRGTIDGTNQYNWCDPTGRCPGDAPCDNVGHGTHVMGTLSGENDDPVGDPNLIGMAPGSVWIACKGCETSTCYYEDLKECAEWIVAPTEVTSVDCTTGTPNPDKRPHVVNNSWGGTESTLQYQTFVQNWRAAGIFPAFAAGNQNDCGSIDSPADYPQSFASANIDDQGDINPIWSSRGPSGIGSTPPCKPNIAAPGTGIVSSVPPDIFETLYYSMTGTSMASPHSAGAVALLWQACPALIGRIDLTFQVLQDNAGAPPPDPCADRSGCGDVGCNCTYGYGYLDARAAVVNCGDVFKFSVYLPLVDRNP